MVCRFLITGALRMHRRSVERAKTVLSGGAGAAGPGPPGPGPLGPSAAGPATLQGTGRSPSV
jgi:hypothetical protein